MGTYCSKGQTRKWGVVNFNGDDLQPSSNGVVYFEGLWEMGGTYDKPVVTPPPTAHRPPPAVRSTNSALSDCEDPRGPPFVAVTNPRSARTINAHSPFTFTLFDLCRTKSDLCFFKMREKQNFFWSSSRRMVENYDFHEHQEVVTLSYETGDLLQFQFHNVTTSVVTALSC